MKERIHFAKIVAGAVATAAVGFGVYFKDAFQMERPVQSEAPLLPQTEGATDLNVAQWVYPRVQKKYVTSIIKSRELVERFKNETGVPGIVVGVSVDGNIIWQEGFGYSNLENGARCHVGTTMRIASISKPITMAVLAKMWEEGEIDLDKPITEYVPYFPSKEVNGEEVAITTRQLASHTSGIRHYTKKGEKKATGPDSNSTEFYIKDNFDSVEDSVKLFKDDELLFKPGTAFEYTTHGYTLLSAVMESVSHKPFKVLVEDFCKLFGMNNTYLDEVNAIIYNRSSYYMKDNNGRILNASLADTSYKWAGGGIVSSVGDLLKFGNGMLYSYQQSEFDKSGFLKRDTINEMWTPVKYSTMPWDKGAGYGLGWIVVPNRYDFGGLEKQEFYIGHGGGAVGASSILLIVPRKITFKSDLKNDVHRQIPSGITVAILANLQDVSCHKLAKKIAHEFGA